jgi:hypothetical protein
MRVLGFYLFFAEHVPEFLQGNSFDLPDAFTRYTDEAAAFIKSVGVLVHAKAKTQGDDEGGTCI